jgi:exodeoxyribonuclease-5
MPIIPPRPAPIVEPPAVAPKTAITLSDEQEQAVKHLLSRVDKCQWQTLGGLAGVGKSFLVSELTKRLRGYAVCAYTGKASNVLRRKGVAATTIHSLIYIFDREEESFRLRQLSELGCDGFIVDEASMCSEAIHNDLLSFGLPIIYVGDHGQLPPIGSAFNLMEKPDIKLETIHRNAGEIARFAEFIRHGGEPRDWKLNRPSIFSQEPIVRFYDWHDQPGEIWAADQIICARNTTRVSLNRAMRRILEYDEDSPVENDRVICLQNNRKAGVFNGMQGTIKRILSATSLIFTDYEGREYRINYRPEHLHCDKPDLHYNQYVTSFDYAYAITAHKSQGDEFSHVCVLDERVAYMDFKRWAYTAASRAKEQLTWISGI